MYISRTSCHVKGTGTPTSSPHGFTSLWEVVAGDIYNFPKKNFDSVMEKEDEEQELQDRCFLERVLYNTKSKQSQRGGELPC